MLEFSDQRGEKAGMTDFGSSAMKWRIFNRQGTERAVVSQQLTSSGSCQPTGTTVDISIKTTLFYSLLLFSYFHDCFDFVSILIDVLFVHMAQMTFPVRNEEKNRKASKTVKPKPGFFVWMFRYSAPCVSRDAFSTNITGALHL